MNVSLTSELERWVQEKVETGRYQSASEVVREGLRLLQEREQLQLARLEDLRRDLAVGLEQLGEGRGTPFDEALVERVKRTGRERLGLRKP